MKTFLCLLFALASFSIRAAEDVADDSDLNAIKISTPDAGIVNAGSIKDVRANYPALRAKLRTQAIARLDSDDDLAAAARLKKLQTAGITLPQATLDKVNARIEALRVKKEAALIAVATTNPARAKTKMDELIAAGILISTATQNAVHAAQPSPSAAPSPPASDGL